MTSLMRYILYWSIALQPSSVKTACLRQAGSRIGQRLFQAVIKTHVFKIKVYAPIRTARRDTSAKDRCEKSRFYPTRLAVTPEIALPA